MSGSLNHITDENGFFTMDLIENLGDATEALHDCQQIIAHLLDEVASPCAMLRFVCKRTRTPVPKDDMGRCILPKAGVSRG